TNLPRECAPQTFNLIKHTRNDVAQPVTSCVGAFRVRYFDGANYREDITNLGNLRAIRLCLLVQMGGRTGVGMEVPPFSTNCGGSFTLPTQDWRWYRWKVVEEDLLLENLR
ncbi:MAG: prepilin-type cleavage/methylation domain-containing protein, partial [Aquificaceae bacterium]|nr:prepilin-type cleavage/methylation domain-containing protein [Aquificaceae bacterium]